MLRLIPYPNGEVIEYEGKFIVPSDVCLKLGNFSTACVTVFLKRTGISLGSTNWLTICEDTLVVPEGYIVDINSSGVTVKASTERGIIYALSAVYSLMQNRELPICHIEDSPRYSYRGLNLDCVRHFFPVSEVKRFIDAMSLLRMNVLHWHLSDDQGWRIESKVFPKLQGVNHEYFTRNEIQDIVEFAALRGIDILPEIDMPGHTLSMITAFPELSCSGKPATLATAGGIYPRILCAGKEETYRFIEVLLSEIIPLFPYRYFHIGGDEAPKSEWEKCTDCRDMINSSGLSDTEELQGMFTDRIVSILKAHGKTAICWNDILEASNAPSDIVIQYWTGRHKKASIPFVEKGGRWIYSDMLFLYLDYPHAMSPLKQIYSIRPGLGKITNGSKSLMGIEACLWTEHIDNSPSLEKHAFPRLLAVAEAAWGSNLEHDYAAFRKRTQALISAGVFRGISFTDENRWDPIGKARSKEALDYLKTTTNSIPEEIRENTVGASTIDASFALDFMRFQLRPADIPAAIRILTGKE